jgi:TetR/AcrR family fatty acid metabolism transcriptional regulator
MAQHAPAEQRRSDILAAAEREFDSRGYAATTMEQVAVGAGISKGSIYNYFPSKQDLFTHVFAERLAVGHAEARRVLSGDMPAAQKLTMLLDGWFMRLSEHKRLSRLLMEFWTTAARETPGGDLSSTFRQIYSSWRALLVDVVEQGAREGAFPSAFDPKVAVVQHVFCKCRLSRSPHSRLA